MRHGFVRASALLVGLAVTAATARAQVAVSVTNPTFTIPTPGIAPGDPAHTPATCAPPEGGSSASNGWTTFGNDETGSITSWLTLAPDGTPANLTTVGGPQNGLVQVLAPQNTLTNVNRVTASVYVLAGQTSVQIGNGGAGGGTTAVSTSARTWETISACGRPDLLNNEIVIYGTEPSVFYVRSASVSFDVKCPTCHKQTVTGPPMAPSCGACASNVCAIDTFCCNSAWDSLCVSEAAAIGTPGGC